MSKTAVLSKLIISIFIGFFIFVFFAKNVFAAPTISITSPANGIATNNTSVNFSASGADHSNLIPNLDNSLVSWWTMNDNSANKTVADYMNNYNGTSQQNTSVLHTTGYNGGALTFNGSSDYISMPTYNFGNNFTIALWVNPTSTSQILTFAANANSGSGTDGFRFYVNYWNTNNRRIILETGGPGGSGWAQTEEGAIPFGSWSFVTATLDRSSGEAHIYVNGVDKTIATSLSTSFKTSDTWLIGKMKDGYPYKGSIDDFMIFNRLLTSDEIMALYNGTAISHASTLTTGSHTYKVYAEDNLGNIALATSDFTVDTTAPTTSVISPINNSTIHSSSVSFEASASDTNLASLVPKLDSSFVSWWRMDDIDGPGNPTDYIGSNNGTKEGSAAQTSSGKLGKGFSFSGANSDYINLGNPASLVFSGTAKRTVSAWIKTTTVSTSWLTAISIDGASFHPMLRIQMDNTASPNRKIAFVIYNGSTDSVLRSTSSISINTWYHVVAIYNGSQMSLYINGSQSGTPITMTPFTGSLIEADIGGHSGHDQNWNGTIDDVMVFNRVLTSDEITALYNGTAINHTSTLADGSHTYSIYAQDLAGNIGTSTVSFTVDTSAPTSTPTPTPTPTATPTPSPTPTIVSISGSDPTDSSSNSSVSAPSCSQNAPSGIPNLYQIDSSATSVTLYFTPVLGADSYYISYGTNSSANQFGASFSNLDTSGALSYTINDLSPGTTYYFTVRGGNGCATGNWSNIRSSKTNGINPISLLTYPDPTEQAINIIKKAAEDNFVEKKIEVKKTTQAVSNKPSILTYVVKAGDSLWSIAQKLLGDGNKYLELISQNPELKNNSLRPGKELKINSLSITPEEAAKLFPEQQQEIEKTGYDLDVKILADSGAPLVGVKVTLHSTPKESVTDREGIAHFKNVEKGKHTIYLAYGSYNGGGQAISVTGDNKNINLTMQVDLKQDFSSPIVMTVVSVMGVAILVLLFIILRPKLLKLKTPKK